MIPDMAVKFILVKSFAIYCKETVKKAYSKCRVRHDLTGQFAVETHVDSVIVYEIIQ